MPSNKFPSKNVREFMAQDDRLKIGLKYCGGCNPGYDRVSIKDQIEKSLKDKILFVSQESDDKEMILAIEGCKIACADLSDFQGLKIWKITSVEDAEEFIREMDYSVNIL
jgi:hypothetical protein